MIKQQDIQAFANDVAEKFCPEKIILFGSYARGNPDLDSDVDILVVMNHSGKPSAQALAIRRGVTRHFPMDLIVRSPRETTLGQKLGDPFITSILADGCVLYDRAG